MKINKFNLFATIVTILSIKIIVAPDANAVEIDTSSSSEFFIEPETINRDRESQISLAQTSQKPAPQLKTAEEYNDRGNERATAGDLQGAIADFTAAIQLRPNYVEAYNNRGDARVAAGDKRGAIADFSKVIELKPNADAEVYKTRADLRWELGEKEGALADFTKVIELKPNSSAEVYKSRGDLRWDLGDKQGALGDFSKVIELKPDSDAEIYKSRGNLRWDLGDKQGALADFSKVIELKPDSDAEIYKSRGNLYWDLGNKQAALTDFDRVLQLTPQDGEVYSSRGSIRAELGDNRGAIADFDRAIQLAPKSAVIYNSRGWARSAMGNKQGALADFTRAIELNPQSAEAYNSRGLLKADLEDRQGAIADYDRALALKPDYTEALENRRSLFFSTTPQVQAEMIFGLGGVSSGGSTRDLISLSKEAASFLTSLSVTTSFTGQDRLLARFQASAFGSPNSEDPRGYIPEGRLSWTDGTINNQPGLQALTYAFPVSPTTEVSLAAKGGDPTEDIAGSSVNPYFGGGGSSGAVSYFGSTPSFYYHGYGTGFGVRQKIGKQLELGAGYLGLNGLFTGESAVLARVLYKPDTRSKIALTYVNADRTQTGTGTRNVNSIYLQSSNQALGLEGFYQVNPNLGLGGWIGHTTSNAADGNANSLGWALTAAFPNLGGNGHVGGLLIGQEPRVTSASGSFSSLVDPGSSTHLEAFYQYKLSDNLSITPGLIYVTSPDSSGQNSGALIGAIRANVSINF
jgi:tetratricopeptide (TPR) repeat protein